jgi:hypothetical protein
MKKNSRIHFRLRKLLEKGRSLGKMQIKILWTTCKQICKDYLTSSSFAQ